MCEKFNTVGNAVYFVILILAFIYNIKNLFNYKKNNIWVKFYSYSRRK